MGSLDFMPAWQKMRLPFQTLMWGGGLSKSSRESGLLSSPSAAEATWEHKPLLAKESSVEV